MLILYRDQTEGFLNGTYIYDRCKFLYNQEVRAYISPKGLYIVSLFDLSSLSADNCDRKIVFQ